ncbi:hypothetical protein M0R72_19505 [Candidatus Pacearchaeota archaeon]|jgi:hypothetical protein|nr:hypothetical protein [Candidatus Pacearchaeota archaeon]
MVAYRMVNVFKCIYVPGAIRINTKRFITTHMKEYYMPLKIIAGGRITIPEEVRRKLKVTVGDVVDVTFATEKDATSDPVA